MTNLTIFNGNNTQEIILSGLVDDNSNPVSGATITAQLAKSGAVLPNSNLVFVPVNGVPGDYAATLNGFDAPPGVAQLQVTGSNAGVTFNFDVFVTIAQRSL